MSLTTMESLVLLLIVILSVFRSAVTSPVTSCEDGLSQMCAFNDLYESIHEDGFSLLHEEILFQHCKDIVEDIECKKKFLSRCNPGEVESFSLATDGVKDVLIDMCNETTDVRKAYRVHSSCIANIENDYQNCIMSLANNVEPEDYSSSGNDITSKEAMIRRMCGFYEPFKSCVTEATRRSCGDSAAQLVQQLVVRMATPAVNAKCSPRNHT